MFNKTYVNLVGKPSSIYANVNVTEKRAPTDDSVKLLMEMEEKATNKLVSIVKVDNSEIKAVAHFFQDPSSPFQNNAIFRMKLNGKSYERKFCVENIHDYEDKIKSIHEAVVSVVSEHFTAQLLTENSQYIFHR